MTTLTQGWDSNRDAAVNRSRLSTSISWICQVAVAVMFVIAGFSKLGGAPAMVQTFDLIGLGQWFRYVTGTVELFSAALLLIPQFALYGALLAAVTMACAVFTHLAILGGSPVPAFVLLLAAASVVWLRKGGR